MKILVVGISWPPETFIERLLKGLLKNDLQITVASSVKPQADWFKHGGFSWLFTPSWNDPIYKRYGMLLFMLAYHTLWHLKNVLLFGGILQNTEGGDSFIKKLFLHLPFCGGTWDVIYFPWNSAAITYLPLFSMKAVMVLSCRGAQVNIAPHNPQRAHIKKGLQATFARAQMVHCVSQDIKREAVAYGLAETKAAVITPAVDTDFFKLAQDRKHPQGCLKVITVGSLIWRKGIEYALRSIKLLSEDEIPVSFNIIGTGPELARAQFTIDDLGLKDKVTLCGAKTPWEVRSELRSADVFLLSSLSEGISNAALEAMACSLPVVATDCGGMRELIQDGKEGYLVPVRDAPAIYLALKKLWEEPESALTMGRLARKKVEEQFRLDQQVSGFSDLFHLALSTAKDKGSD